MVSDMYLPGLLAPAVFSHTSVQRFKHLWLLQLLSHTSYESYPPQSTLALTCMLLIQQVRQQVCDARLLAGRDSTVAHANAAAASLTLLPRLLPRLLPLQAGQVASQVAPKSAAKGKKSAAAVAAAALSDDAKAAIAFVDAAAAQLPELTQDR